MTSSINHTVNDNIADASNRADTLRDLIYKCFNLSDDTLRKPSDLSKFLIYVSIVLSVIVPSTCFALFVYPTMTAYALSKTQVVSIPSLKRQIAQLKQLYQSSHTALTELEADALLVSLHNATQTKYNPIDLHHKAHDHRLKFIEMDTLNNQEVSPRFSDNFTASRFSWHLKGYFSDYLRFKKALWEQHPLIHIEREYLATIEGLRLDIVVDISIYQPKEIAL